MSCSIRRSSATSSSSKASGTTSIRSSANRQFCDVGKQYRPEIFVHNDAQRAAAEASKARMEKLFGERIVVLITTAGAFYPAEEYHQDYYKKNSAQYRFYRFGCGRDRRLQEIWSRALR